MTSRVIFPTLNWTPKSKHTLETFHWVGSLQPTTSDALAVPLPPSPEPSRNHWEWFPISIVPQKETSEQYPGRLGFFVIFFPLWGTGICPV